MSEKINPIFDLVDTDNPDEVFKEVRKLMKEVSPGFSISLLENIFADINKLYRGEFHGYQACTMEYHNFKHTTDVFLAMSRIIHGAVINGESFREKQIFLGLTSALMHDVGYIKKNNEKGGSGAQFTNEHVERGIEFGNEYFKRESISHVDSEEFKNVMLCTKPGKDIAALTFSAASDKLIGKMLGTADLLGQMSDRMYLEKILLLFLEFNEADIGDFKSEKELLENTINFYKITLRKLHKQLNPASEYARIHFRERWNIDRNLYMDYLQQNIDYLRHILSNYGNDYRSFLRRGNIVDKLEKRGL